MLRGMLGLVSLMIVGVGAAFYYSEMQPPVAQAGQYPKVETQVDHTADLMAHRGDDAQAQVDAAAGGAAPAPTKAPAPAPPASP